MGYRISGVEERYLPQNLTNLVPTYDPTYTYRTGERALNFQQRESEKRAALDKEMADIIPGAIQKYAEEGDRRYRRAESEQAMRLNERKGALTEEQIRASQQARALEEKFGERRAEAQIGQSESAMNLAQRQLEQADLQLGMARQEQQFLQRPAAEAGFKDALPGETVQAYQLRAGVETQGLDRKVKLAQIEAQKDVRLLNQLNAQVAKLGIDETQRTARVRDMVARLSMTDNPEQARAISQEFAAMANPAEYAEALKTVQSNKMQSDMLREEMERRRPEYGYFANKQAEASDTGAQVASIMAAADRAVDLYGSAKTPWSDKASDAVTSIQAQLRAAGYDKQADDLDSVLGSGLDFGTARQDRLKQSVVELSRSLGKEFEAKYGHLGDGQFAQFGQALQAKSYGTATGPNGKARNVFLQGQQPASSTLIAPLPSRNNSRPWQPQQQPQQSVQPPPQIQMAAPPQMTPIPPQQPMPRGPQVIPTQQQQQQQMTPMQPQQPLFQLPSSFKPVRQLGQQ